MPRRVKGPDGVVRTFPDDATDDEISAALEAPEQATPSKPMTERIAGMLPMAGGMVGSLVGGGIGGAALGGAAGQGYGELLKHATEIPGALVDVARNFINPETRGATMTGAMEGMTQGVKDAGLSGAIQGGSEAVGMGLAKGASALAPRLMQSILKPTKALRAEFPTVAQDAVNYGVSVGKAGEKKVGKLIDTTAGKVREKLNLAQRMGAKPVSMGDVVPELQTVAQKVAKEPLDAGAKLTELSDIGGRLIQQHPNPISLLEAQEMKQAAQRVATSGYKQQAMGAPINSVTPDANMAIARGLRKEIEKRANVGPLNEETQKLIGVDRALEHALGRIGNNQPIGMNDALSMILGSGTAAATGDMGMGLGAGALMKLLATPATGSRIAIGLDRAAPAIAQIPNAGRAALLAQLGMSE